MQQNITQSVFPNILTEKDYTIPVFIGIAKRVFTESPINLNTNSRGITLTIPDGYMLSNEIFDIKLTYWANLFNTFTRQAPLPTSQQVFENIEFDLGRPEKLNKNSMLVGFNSSDQIKYTSTIWGEEYKASLNYATGEVSNRVLTKFKTDTPMPNTITKFIILELRDYTATDYYYNNSTKVVTFTWPDSERTGPYATSLFNSLITKQCKISYTIQNTKLQVHSVQQGNSLAEDLTAGTIGTIVKKHIQNYNSPAYVIHIPSTDYINEAIEQILLLNKPYYIVPIEISPTVFCKFIESQNLENNFYLGLVSLNFADLNIEIPFDVVH